MTKNKTQKWPLNPLKRPLDTTFAIKRIKNFPDTFPKIKIDGEKEYRIIFEIYSIYPLFEKKEKKA